MYSRSNQSSPILQSEGAAKDAAGSVTVAQNRRKKFSQNRGGSSATLDSSDDECGTGILEFSPDMAGRDVTPAPEIALQMVDQHKRISGGSGAFSAIAGSSSESEVYSSHGKISLVCLCVSMQQGLFWHGEVFFGGRVLNWEVYFWWPSVTILVS